MSPSVSMLTSSDAFALGRHRRVLQSRDTAFHLSAQLGQRILHLLDDAAQARSLVALLLKRTTNGTVDLRARAGLVRFLTSSRKKRGRWR